MAVSAFQLHDPYRDGVPPDMKCKRPKHSLTPFRVVWLTACRFTQRPCGKYSSAGGICQISPAAICFLPCLRRGTFFPKRKYPKNGLRGEGFRFPSPLKDPLSLKRPNGEGCGPPLWKPPPGGVFRACGRGGRMWASAPTHGYRWSFRRGGRPCPPAFYVLTVPAASAPGTFGARRWWCGRRCGWC